MDYILTLGSQPDIRHFRDFQVTGAVCSPDGSLQITVKMEDQAGLFALISKIRDLNLPLNEIRKVPAGGGTEEVH